MRSRHALLTPFHSKTLLELALVLWLASSVLAVCPSLCSCSRNHREVNCSSKGLRHLPDGLQHNLHSLNLSHNRFTSLDGELAPYTHLRILDVSHNRLSWLPQELPRSLWQLHASFNRMHLLEKNNTAYQWNLRILDLSHNKLERAIFINNTLINLHKLNLSHNHFWTVPTNLPAHLEIIDLSHNFLVKVLPGSLDRLPALTHFYLHSNRFSSLPFRALDKLTSLQIITLGNNPWACHLYADIYYLQSWSQHTSARVLGCPCHTQPVCGGAHAGRNAGWNFASYNSPPLSAGASTSTEGTGWWYLSESTLPRTSHNRWDNLETKFPTSTPDTVYTSNPHRSINHPPGTASTALINQLISSTKETSPPDSLHTTDSSHFLQKSLITEASRANDVATDQFFTTESAASQTKKTTTLRTRSVRRRNQQLPGGISSSSSFTLTTSSLQLFLGHLALVFLVTPHYS